MGGGIMKDMLGVGWGIQKAREKSPRGAYVLLVASTPDNSKLD